jgi:hypothetical protein
MLWLISSVANVEQLSMAYELRKEALRVWEGTCQMERQAICDVLVVSVRLPVLAK